MTERSYPPNSGRIKELRTREGYSQEECAKVTGISKKSIQRMETGKKARIGTLKLFAEKFQCDVFSLIAGTESKPRSVVTIRLDLEMKNCDDATLKKVIQAFEAWCKPTGPVIFEEKMAGSVKLVLRMLDDDIHRMYALFRRDMYSAGSARQLLQHFDRFRRQMKPRFYLRPLYWLWRKHLSRLAKENEFFGILLGVDIPQHIYDQFYPKRDGGSDQSVRATG